MDGVIPDFHGLERFPICTSKGGNAPVQNGDCSASFGQAAWSSSWSQKFQNVSSADIRPDLQQIRLDSPRLDDPDPYGSRDYMMNIIEQ